MYIPALDPTHPLNRIDPETDEHLYAETLIDHITAEARAEFLALADDPEAIDAL